MSTWMCGVTGDALAQGAKRIVISTAAGGGLDSIARKLAQTQALRSAWGNPIVLDNMPGQNGLLATEHMRGLHGDDSTILVVYVNESGPSAAAFAPTASALAGLTPIAYLGSNTGPHGKAWYGAYGPPGIPADLVRRMESALQSAMQSSDVTSVTSTLGGWQHDRAVSASTLVQLTGGSTGQRTVAQSAGQGAGTGAPITTGDSAACRCLSLSADTAGEIIRNNCSREIVVFLCVEGYNCRGERSHTNSGVTPKGTTGSFPDHFRVRNENQGKRQRWGYGAAFRDGLAPTAASMGWPQVQANRLVCSENREPVIVPRRVN